MPSQYHSRVEETIRYQLWGQARHFCEYEITTERADEPAIRSLFPPDWSGESQRVEPEFELRLMVLTSKRPPHGLR
jgi:hypothetical protein